MGRILVTLLGLTLLGSCFFDDWQLDDKINQLNLEEDTVSFHEFAVVVINQDNEVFNEAGNISVKFTGISQDSRCPIDAICETPGTVSAKFELIEDGMQRISTTLTIPGNYNSFDYKYTYFRLLKVDPYPATVDTPINNYSITMEIRPVDSDCQSAIIDTWLFNNPWTDDFTFENVQVSGDKILTEIKYGGGCGIIQYEMVSEGLDLESDPPKIILLLSFKDEDDCEALVTTTLCSELRIFQSDSYRGPVQINLVDWDDTINYFY
jgi:hypothetical protein